MRVLDTDTCIEILRGNQAVIARRQRTVDEVGTTWISVAELQYGAAKSRFPAENRAAVGSLLGSLTVVGLDALSVRIFGEAKALLELRGERPADADLLIGAICVAQGAAVVTRNRRHYERIPGLVVEDWTGP